jgi:hypothetical protein
MLSEDLEEFFSSNICIPRGVNRHNGADEIHEWVEDITKILQCELEGKWYTYYPFGTDARYRIKPKEPVYEYKVRMMYSDGTYELTDRHFTVDEYREFGFPKTCTLEDTTKRIRQ